MPRLARLDAPGVLHHVMGRGIERKAIFYSDTDRSDFIDRLAVLVDEGALNVYAWVLMPNHFHLLCKTRNRPLSSSMRKILVGGGLVRSLGGVVRGFSTEEPWRKAAVRSKNFRRQRVCSRHHIRARRSDKKESEALRSADRYKCLGAAGVQEIRYFPGRASFRQPQTGCR